MPALGALGAAGRPGIAGWGQALGARGLGIHGVYGCSSGLSGLYVCFLWLCDGFLGFPGCAPLFFQCLIRFGSWGAEARDLCFWLVCFRWTSTAVLAPQAVKAYRAVLQGFGFRVWRSTFSLVF